MSRFPHRLKTHGRWRLKQPTPGVFLWRSPHGWYFHVDHTGTHPIPKRVGDAAWSEFTRTARPGGAAGPPPAETQLDGGGPGIDLDIDVYPTEDPVLEYQPRPHTDTA